MKQFYQISHLSAGGVKWNHLSWFLTILFFLLLFLIRFYFFHSRSWNFVIFFSISVSFVCAYDAVINLRMEISSRNYLFLPFWWLKKKNFSLFSAYSPAIYQKRFKKERKARLRIQHQLDAEMKRRNQIEDVLKASGAPAETLRLLTG